MMFLTIKEKKLSLFNYTQKKGKTTINDTSPGIQALFTIYKKRIISWFVRFLKFFLIFFIYYFFCVVSSFPSLIIDCIFAGIQQ